jgi:hypothetical protein
VEESEACPPKPSQIIMIRNKKEKKGKKKEKELYGYLYKKKKQPVIVDKRIKCCFLKQ